VPRRGSLITRLVGVFADGHNWEMERMNDQERKIIEPETRRELNDWCIGVPRRVIANREIFPSYVIDGEAVHDEWRELPLMTDEIRQRLPELYSTADIEDPVVQIRYKAWRCCDWNAIEFDGEDIFFGFVWVEAPVWGYFRLSDLDAVKVPHCSYGIAVDRYFEPEPISQVMMGYYYDGPC